MLLLRIISYFFSFFFFFSLIDGPSEYFEFCSLIRFVVVPHHFTLDNVIVQFPLVLYDQEKCLPTIKVLIVFLFFYIFFVF
jgi:hypothetical protein